MKNKIALFGYLALVGYAFMQAGASLFAITVNVSTLIQEPPASLHMVQGEYRFNPDIFWGNFPNIGMLLFVVALILNWKTHLRKWVLLGFGLGILAALSAIFLMGPVQSAFLNAPFSETLIPELKVQGNLWYNYSLLFFILSLLSGFVYVFGLVNYYQKSTPNHSK